MGVFNTTLRFVRPTDKQSNYVAGGRCFTDAGFFPCTLCESWHSVNNVEGVGSRKEAGGGKVEQVKDGAQLGFLPEQVVGACRLHTQPGSGLEGRPPALAGQNLFLEWQVAGACCLLSRCVLAVSTEALNCWLELQ